MVREKGWQGDRLINPAFLNKVTMGEISYRFLERKRSNRMWKERLERYDELVAKCPRFERKGKTVPYTSANGHMFSILNKEGQLGLRFSKEVQEKYIQEFDTTIFKSHGSVMRGYVLIPDHMLEDMDQLAEYLNESYDYVMSLEPK